MRDPLVEALRMLVRAAAPALGFGLVFGLGFTEKAALADVTAPASKAEAPLLVVTVPEIAGSDVDDRAAGTVAAHVRESGARVQVVRHAAGALGMRRLLVDAQGLAKTWDARGVIWIDVGRGGDAGVYLLEAGASQVFGRRVAAPAAQISAAIESLANIAGSAAAELLEGRVVGMAPVAIASAEGALSEAPVAETSDGQRAGAVEGAGAVTEIGTGAAPVAAPVPAPKQDVDKVAAPDKVVDKGAVANKGAASGASFGGHPPSSALDNEGQRWPRVGLSAGYTGNTFGAGIPWQSAISLFAAVEPSHDGWIGLGYDLSFPQHFGDDHIRIELNRHPLLVSGGYRFGLGGSWDFQVGARVAVDFMTRRFDDGLPPPPPGAPRMPPESRLDIVWSAAPMLGLGFGITDRTRAAVFGGMEVPLTRVPSMSPSPFHTDEPAPVRLLVGASLQFDVFVPGSPPSVRSARR